MTSQGCRDGDIVIEDDRISHIAPPGEGGPADQVLDARRLWVLPGVVDLHVHFNDPGRTRWEGFATGSSAAAAGGTTTVVDMPLNCSPVTVDAQALAQKGAAVAGRSYVDYAFWGGIVPGNGPSLPALHAGGVVGFKAFLCDSGLAEFPAVDPQTLSEAMARVAGLGSLVAVHAEDQAMTRRLTAELKAAGRTDRRAYLASRPVAAELAGVREAIAAAEATGCRLHVVHASCPQTVQLVAAAKARGLPVTVETCPHYLALTADDFERLGPVAKCAPPLRDAGEREGLWGELLAGRIDLVASDHSPCPPEMKVRGEADVWLAWGGINGVQTVLTTMLTFGVHARRWGVEALVTALCTRPAQVAGFYPKKGVIAPGADADLVLVDPDRDHVLAPEELRYRHPRSPLVGERLRGRVVKTLLRGEIVFDLEAGLLGEPRGRPAMRSAQDSAAIV